MDVWIVRVMIPFCCLFFFEGLERELMMDMLDGEGAINICL